MSSSSDKLLLVYQILKDNELKSIRLDYLLSDRLINNDFSNSDLRFIHKLVYGITRNKRTLDFHIEKTYDGKYKKLLTKFKILLRIGLYQIHYMNSVPDYASVNTVVELAKIIDKNKVGLVNAILRNLSKLDLIDNKNIDKLSIKYNHPDWMIDKWSKVHENQTLLSILEANNREPIIWFRINSLKTNQMQVKSILKNIGVEIEFCSFFDNFFKSSSPQKVLKSELINKDFVSVQNPSNGLVVKLLDPKKDKVIIDGCSAPGGKLKFINEITGGNEEIKCYDSDQKRLGIINNYLKKYKIINISCQTKNLANEKIEEFDLGLLDVPCSGTGVMSKRADLRWRRRPSDLKEMIQIQSSILANVAKYVKQSGVLVYSTCSIEEEENWQIIDNFLNSNSNFELDLANKFVPKQFVDNNGCLSILPNSYGLDGIFAARLIKK